MRKYRCEIGRVSGKYYKLICDTNGNQQAIDPEYANIWRWFLWIGGNSNDYYEGDFRLKREALEHVERAKK